MKEGGGFQRLLRKTKFASQLIAIIIDEVHCLKFWNSFRHDYQDLGRLRFILPDRVHFALVSATLPRPVLVPVLSHLGVTSKDLHAIRLSNDRDNIALVVWKMKYPAGSYRDLGFLVPGSAVSDASGNSRRHKRFVIFFDNKKEATNAGRYLRQRLPIDQRNKVIWFMADMSAGFKEAGVSDLASGKLLGTCATIHSVWRVYAVRSRCVLTDVPSGYRLEGHRPCYSMESCMRSTCDVAEVRT